MSFLDKSEVLLDEAQEWCHGAETRRLYRLGIGHTTIHSLAQVGLVSVGSRIKHRFSLGMSILKGGGKTHGACEAKERLLKFLMPVELPYVARS